MRPAIRIGPHETARFPSVRSLADHWNESIVRLPGVAYAVRLTCAAESQLHVLPSLISSPAARGFASTTLTLRWHAAVRPLNGSARATTCEVDEEADACAEEIQTVSPKEIGMRKLQSERIDGPRGDGEEAPTTGRSLFGVSNATRAVAPVWATAA
jgi:hypothetical protein